MNNPRYKNAARILRWSPFLLLLVVASFSSCDKSDEESGVKGHVSVVDGDAAGVVVKLYAKPDVSNDVYPWSVTSANQSVGFGYTTRMGFIHRIVTDERRDTLDAGGNFQFNALVDGEYIVVADGNTYVKHNFGWSVPRDITVSGGKVDFGDVTLEPDTVLSLTTVIGELVIPEGRHWLLDGTFFISAGGRVIVEPGAVVRLSPSREINVLAGGELIANGTPDKPIVFTTDQVINRQPSSWGSIRYSEGAAPPQFSNCRFEHAGATIETRADGGYIKNCFFYGCLEAVRSTKQPPEFTNNVVQQAGIGYFSGSNEGLLIEHNLFQTCQQYSIQLDHVDDASVFCNWFRDGGGSDTAGGSIRGVMRLDFVANSEIVQNNFETSWYALSVNSGVDSTLRIHHNRFHRIQYVLDVNSTPDAGVRSMPRFDHNCMTNIGTIFVRIRSCHINDVDIHAENNYWSGSISETHIKNQLVWDCVNQQGCPCLLITPPVPTCESIEAETDTVAGICQF